jgi:hypothetical protein
VLWAPCDQEMGSAFHTSSLQGSSSVPIPDRTILRTYVGEYQSHNRMILSYIIQRIGQSIPILSRSCPHWRSTHPFLRRFLHVVLHDHEHVTFHTTRSWPHWRSTHLFFRRFVRLVLHDHEHVTLYTTRSWPHWRSTHTFLRRFVRLILHDHEHVTLHTT